jgi:hypothetical protein
VVTALIAVGSVTATVAEVEQPLLLLTTQVYVPAVNPVAVALVPPEGDHK